MSSPTIIAAGGLADALVLDVTDVRAFATAIEASEPYDIFVNNAGTNRPALLKDVTEEDFDHIIGLNLRAAVFTAQAVALGMVRAGNGGSIINMSSQMGHIGAAKRSIYCASKWAIEGFTKAMAIELGPHAIRVNTICPTFIETPLTKPYFEDPAFRHEVLDKIKLWPSWESARHCWCSGILGIRCLVTDDWVCTDGGRRVDCGITSAKQARA